MKPEYQLISFHILEKFHTSKLITWSYPSASDETKEILLQRALEKDEPQTFSFHRATGTEWVYIWERYNEMKVYALALVTKSFNPDKYRQFGSLLCAKYEKSYDAVHLMKIYLGAFTNGFYVVHENGTQVKVDFGGHEKKPGVGELVALFGIETILLYNALLLKKRILVYHPDLVVLQKNLLLMTQLIEWKYRDPNDYLFPLVRNTHAELKGKSFFIAGLLEKMVNVKNDFDLFVNLQSKTINISLQSKETFTMTKIHKEIGELMVQLTNADDCDDSKLVTQLNAKTKDVLVNLKSLATTEMGIGNRPMISLEELRSRKFTPAMEGFLFNLAIAENIMML